MYFVLQKSLKNSPKTTSAVTVIFSAPPPSYRTTTAASSAPQSPAPCRHRRSFLITATAFGSSWVKKGGGGLGLGWWWLRI